MIVFTRTLRDRQRSSLWWAAALFGFMLFSVAFYPTVKGQADIDEIVQDLPASVQALFGIQDGVSIGSAAGYLQARLFSSLYPAILVAFAITAGASAVGSAEEEGAMELLLSNPIARHRAAIERFAAMAAILAALTAGSGVVLAIAGAPVGLFDGVSAAGVSSAIAGAGALALLHGAIAASVGAWTGRRGPALGIASGVALAGYLGFGLMSSAGLPLLIEAASPWYWYLHENMAIHGANFESWLPALVISLAIAAVGVAKFSRRDLR